MLEYFPLPKTREGWLTAGILIIFSFLIFYSLLYPDYLGFYNQFFSRETGVLSSNENVQFRFRIPKYTFQDTAQWGYIRIYNGSQETLRNAAIIVNVCTEGEANHNVDFSTLHRFPRDSSDLVYQAVVEVGDILPGTFKIARVRIITDRNGQQEVNFSLRKDSGDAAAWSGDQTAAVEDIVIPTGFIRIETNNISALAYSFVENMMLPPWANGLIPLFVLFCCYIVESSVIPSKDKGIKLIPGQLAETNFFSRKWICNGFLIFFGALGGVITIIGAIYMIMSITKNRFLYNNVPVGLDKPPLDLFWVFIFFLLGLFLVLKPVIIYITQVWRLLVKKLIQFNWVLNGINRILHCAGFSQAVRKEWEPPRIREGILFLLIPAGVGAGLTGWAILSMLGLNRPEFGLETMAIFSGGLTCLFIFHQITNNQIDMGNNHPRPLVSRLSESDHSAGTNTPDSKASQVKGNGKPSPKDSAASKSDEAGVPDKTKRKGRKGSVNPKSNQPASNQVESQIPSDNVETPDRTAPMQEMKPEENGAESAPENVTTVESSTGTPVENQRLDNTFCLKCGQEIPPGVSNPMFCIRCGAQLR